MGAVPTPEPAQAAAGDRVEFPWVMQVSKNQPNLFPIYSAGFPGCVTGSDSFNVCRTYGFSYPNTAEALDYADVWSFPAAGEQGLVIRKDGACFTHGTASGVHANGDFTQVKLKGSAECNPSGSATALKHSVWYHDPVERTLVAVENGARSSFAFGFDNTVNPGHETSPAGKLTNGQSPMGGGWVFPDPRLFPQTPVPSGPDVAKSALTVSTGIRAPNGIKEHTATATVKNSAGTVLAGQTVNFRIFNEAGSALATTAKIKASGTTNASGQAIVPITATAAGTYTVEATIGGKHITDSMKKRVTFAYEVSQGNSMLEVSSNTRYVNGPDPHTTKATIRSSADTGSVGMAGQDVTFTMLTSTGAATTDAKVLPGTVRTNSAGVAEATITATKAGTYRVQAKVLGSHISGSPNLTVTFIDKPVDPPVDPPGGVDLSKSALTVTTGSREANHKTQHHQAIAGIKDANGDGLSWQAVSFKLYNWDRTPATEATITSSVNTNAQGLALAKITASAAGNYWVEARVGGKEITNSNKLYAVFVDAPPVVSPEQSSLSVTAHKPYADGVSEHQATATILSTTGTAMPTQTVQFAVFTQTGTATTDAIITASAATDATGKAIATITAKKPGLYMVEATVGGKPVTGSRQRFVEFIAVPLVTMTCPAPDSQDGTVTLAGANVPITATKVRVYKREGTGAAQLWGDAVLSGSGVERTWSFTGKTPLPSGTFTFTARSVDAAGKESADSAPACPMTVTRELPLTGEKHIAPVLHQSSWVPEITENNWEITVTEGTTVQVISGGGSAELTPGKSYTLGERLRAKPVPEPSAKLYTQAGNFACLDGGGIPLPSSVFNAATGVITLDASGSTRVTPPISCAVTNQTANVSFITKREGGQQELPARGWKLDMASAADGFDVSLDDIYTVLDARPGTYDLTATAPAGLSVAGIERLRLGVPACRALANDPISARESCWEHVGDGGRGVTDAVPQGSHSVFRVLTAAPLEMPALPLTGGIGSWQFTAAGGAALLLAASAYVLRSRRSVLRSAQANR